MSWVAAAIAGSAVLGAGASIYGANQQKNAGNAAINTQNQQYQQTRSDLMPYANEGQLALPQLNAMLGLGPGGMAGAQSALAATPGYQWALNQGSNNILNRRSSLGGVLSGGTLTALEDYGQGLASQQYGATVNNLFRAVGGGQNAAAGIGGFGANEANQVSNLQTGIGNAGAAGTAGVANAGNTAIQNWLFANYLQQRGAGGFGGGGGGGIPMDAFANLA